MFNNNALFYENNLGSEPKSLEIVSLSLNEGVLQKKLNKTHY